MSALIQASGTNDCCTPTGKYELCGCAGGVPYIQLTVVGGGTVQTAWLNTETGDTFTTKPAGFVTGTCQDALLADVLQFSATAPTPTAPFATPKDGDTTIRTSDGTATGAVVGLYLYDEQTATWKLIPTVAAGGNIGDVYTKLPDGTYGWAAPATQAILDNQVLTGDTTTNTTVTMTPVTVTDESGGTQVNYTVKAEAKIDGTTITQDPTTKVLSAANQKPDALTTAQPTPTATGNTTNLNTVFKDASGSTWFVDYNGDAVLMGSAPFKELNRFYVDPNGVDTNAGANEAPFLTVQAAVAALAAGDIAVVNEGVYSGAVTMSTANTSMSGADGAVNSLTQIGSLAVTTASGTSNKVSDLTVLGAVTHSGGAPLYLHSVTVNGNYVSTSAAYEEINDCRMQDGTITKTTAGTLYIKDSLIGNATFNTANTVVSLDNVSIDAGETLTIGAGVVYMLNDVRGHVVIDPAAIPLNTVALAQGLTGLAAKSTETASFNDVRLTNVPTITTATKLLVRDADGVVSEQAFPVVLTTTTSIVPKVYQGAGYVDAQANNTNNVCDALLLSDGTYFNAGRLKYSSHPFTVGKWYYLNQTTAGAVIGTYPTTGIIQQLFFVEDANTLLVNIEQAIDPAAPSYANLVYVNGTDPASATIFDLNTPPTVDDPALKNDSDNLYIGTDGSSWYWNGTAYVTKTFASSTEWNLAGTSVDAQGNKTAAISRAGSVAVGANIAPLSTLDNSGSFGTQIVRKTANYTATAADTTIVADTIGITITLPTPVGVTRRFYVVKNETDGQISAVGLIDSTTSRTVNLGQRESIMVQSDGARWVIVAKYSGEYATQQQGVSGQPLVGTHTYFNSNSNYTSPLTLPASAPYVGFEFIFTSNAQSVTVINTTNTDMAAALSVSQGFAKVFKWTGAKWALMN